MMQTKQENRLEQLKSLLEPFAKGMSIGKRQYANKLLEEIVTDINKQELVTENLTSKLAGFDNYQDYTTALGKSISIMAFFGMTAVDFLTMRKDILEWMKNNKIQLTKPVTWCGLINTYKMVEHFWIFEDRFPNDFEELKKYIDTLKND